MTTMKLRPRSNPSTPLKPSNALQNDTSYTAASPTKHKCSSANSTPTRSQPMCRKCGLPRKGHPRAGCPNEANPSPLRFASKKPVSSTGITNSLQSFQLDYDEIPTTPIKPQAKSVEEERKEMLRLRRLSAAPRKALAPSPSLNSITSSDLLELLDSSDGLDSDQRKAVEGGDDSDSMIVDQEESKSDILAPNSVPPVKKVVRWQDAIRRSLSKTPSPDKERRRLSHPRQMMPCTLNTPSPQTSFASIDTASSSGSSSTSEDVVFQKSEPLDIIPEQVLGATPKSVNTPQLGRDLDDEEKEAIVDSILKLDSAGIIMTIPKDMALNAKYAAEQAGLFTRQRIINEDEESFLVVGVDEKEVERLWISLLKLEGHENPYLYASLPGLVGERGAGISQPAAPTPKKTERRRISGGAYLAGGAAAGAVATFGALAFT